MMLIKQFVYALILTATSSTLIAEPTVEGNTISWPDDGWYQVQAADTWSEVCSGGRSCTVDPGEYIVINHSTGARYRKNIQADASSAPASVSVSGNVISWPDDGWYQVQNRDNWREVCSGGRSCTADPGRYIVINHTTQQRTEVAVEAETPVSPVVTLTGLTISWPDDGWYQVQNADNWSEVCSGGRSCVVEPGTYNVINHTTGVRISGLVVEETAPIPPPEETAPLPPPSELEGVVYTVTEAELFWERGESLVLGWQVWRDGTMLTTVEGPSLYMNDLEPSTSYTMEVAAIDENGQPGGRSILTLSTPEDIPVIRIGNRVQLIKDVLQIRNLGQVADHLNALQALVQSMGLTQLENGQHVVSCSLSGEVTVEKSASAYFGPDTWSMAFNACWHEGDLWQGQIDVSYDSVYMSSTNTRLPLASWRADNLSWTPAGAYPWVFDGELDVTGVPALSYAFKGIHSVTQREGTSRLSGILKQTCMVTTGCSFVGDHTWQAPATGNLPLEITGSWAISTPSAVGYNSHISLVAKGPTGETMNVWSSRQEPAVQVTLSGPYSGWTREVWDSMSAKGIDEPFVRADLSVNLFEIARFRDADGQFWQSPELISDIDPFASEHIASTLRAISGFKNGSLMHLSGAEWLLGSAFYNNDQWPTETVSGSNEVYTESYTDYPQVDGDGLPRIDPETGEQIIVRNYHYYASRTVTQCEAPENGTRTVYRRKAGNYAGTESTTQIRHCRLNGVLYHADEFSTYDRGSSGSGIDNYVRQDDDSLIKADELGESSGPWGRSASALNFVHQKNGETVLSIDTMRFRRDTGSIQGLRFGRLATITSVVLSECEGESLSVCNRRLRIDDELGTVLQLNIVDDIQQSMSGTLTYHNGVEIQLLLPKSSAFKF